MKELEEANCEARRIVNLQFPVLNWLRNSEYGQSVNFQEHGNVNDCRGGFLHNATYAWLSCGCHLVIFNVKIGESISSWTFRGVVTSVSQFPAQSGEFPLLLVGVDNCANKLKDSSGLLCIFDCTTSRILRAIRMPCGIEQVCVVSGGAEWEEFNDKRPDNILSEMDGIACVALRNLHHIMIDLRRSVWDTHDLSVVMDEISPAQIDFPSAKQIIGRHQSIREKHTAYNLFNNRIEKHIGFNREDFESSPFLGENLTTALISSTKIGCLISGCLGRVIIWQNDGSIGWISMPIDENMTVTHLALLEPTDDPRPFYYLWVVFQDELSKTPPILRMYAMLFERKYCDRETNLYFNLENDPNLKFESELNEGDKVISLCAIERESNPEQTESTIKRGEDNLLLIATNDRVFLFDLNQWYKEQMPCTISECQNPNSILATYRTRLETQNESNNQIISFAYIPHSLQEFSSNGPSSPEELFYPNSLSFEWVELGSAKLTFWMTRGIQTDLLREIATTGPIILIQPFETFHRCLSVGLIPFNSEFSFASDQNAQREMLLSLCLEQRWSTFLIKCAMEWSDGSASYLYPTFLRWGVQRASSIKMIADRLCIPLFDQSGSSIGEADVKTLRFCSQQLECLSNVVAKLPSTTMDLTKQQKTLKRISTYFQVLLWFYDVGLLPETQDLEEKKEEKRKKRERAIAMNAKAKADENANANTELETEKEEEQDEEENITLPISLILRVPYPYEKLFTLYKEKRAQFLRNNSNNSENEEDLFIDELITRECSILKAQWEREGGIATHGCYPPPSLQSLLRSYLIDCDQTEVNEINCRHQITIYLLMDLAMLLQRLYPAVKQLIKYPSAFMMSPSLIKLTQAFWLLDHENYQEFLDTMTGQLICDSDIKDWHHRLVLRTLMRNNQHKLAFVYLRVRKPPLSSIEEQGVAISLSIEHGLVQSAFHHRPPCHYEQLLTSFFRACRKYDKLNEILHLVLDSEEEEIFVKFLEENKMEDLRLLYYLQRCRYTEVISGYSIRQYQSNLVKNIQSTSINMLGAYDMTLPDITKRFSTNAATISDMDLKARYSRPMSHCKSHDKLRSIYETVITKARETYLRGEKCQIPFVSAPCMSLKCNAYGVNMNCVLFPSLMRKGRGKRTIDQIYGEDEEDSVPESVKRRKLSDSPSKRASGELGFQETFDTPLVKRKPNTCANKDSVLETPQSILKIKQLARSSISPVTSQAKESADRLSEKERKSRQIRFSINQSKRTLVYEDNEEKKDEEMEEEEEEREQDKIEIDGPFESDLNDETSDDAFFSPNKTGNKSAYCESAVLNDDSNISGKIYCYARPRPSLRRSALQSSIQVPQESCVENADNFSADNSPANLSTATSSIRKDVTVYSTTMLSSDSSVDISCPKTSRRSSTALEKNLSMKRYGTEKFLISSTPLTKNIVSLPMRPRFDEIVKLNPIVLDESDNEFLEFKNDDDNDQHENQMHVDSQVSVSVNDKRSMEIDDTNNVHRIEEDLNTPRESKSRSEHIARTGNVLLEQKDTSNKIVESESQQNRYNNGGIAREDDLNLQNIETTGFDKITESNPVVSNESDNELLGFQNDDNNEQRENRMDVDSEVSASCSFHEALNSEHEAQAAYSAAKLNGLQESMMCEVDLTDDESAHSRTATPAISHDEAANNKKKTSTVYSEHVLYDTLNITDDESNSSIRETDKPKANDDEHSNLQRSNVPTRNIETERSNDKSDEEKQRINLRKNLDKSLQIDADVDNELKKICSSYVKLRKIDDSRIEVSDQEASSFSKTRDSRLPKSEESESVDLSESTRMTRSRKADSTAKDTSVQQAEKKMTRRRVSSSTKDSPLRHIEKASQIQGANSKKENSSMSGRMDVGKLWQSRGETLSDDPLQEANQRKSSRTRRSNSVAKEIKTSSPAEKLRGRRASSLVKDVLMSSITTVAESLEPQSAYSDLKSPVRASRRCASVAKDSNSEGIKDEPPVRRSTRLASVTKKDLQDGHGMVEKRSKSAMSFARSTSDDEESENKKSVRRRTRKSSVSSDTDTIINKSLRSSAKDLDEDSVKKIRKRGSSLPKETTVQPVTSRLRRSGSVIEQIPEIAEPPEEEPKRFTREEIVGGLTPNTRTRSSSVLSVPEELEEIFSPSRETRSARKLQANSRQKRAVSVDVVHTEVKKRVRNNFETTKIIATSPIMEESVEDTMRLEKDEKADSKVTQDASTSKRRKAATKEMKEGIAKPRRGRPRKISVTRESNDLFSFSLPERTEDVPSDVEGIEQVPNYVFSPPQTRSKNISSSQYQK